MFELPGADLWSKEHYVRMKKFIIGQLSEEELMRTLEEDNSKHYFGFKFLKINYEQEYSRFIKKLSLKNRRIFLLEADNTGFTQVLLAHATGYSEKMINNFKFSTTKNDVTNIYFLNMISLVCRVPTHWLTKESTQEIYDSMHLLYVKDADYSIDRFKSMIARVTKKSRFVTGVRLALDSIIVYLRIEIIYGALLIEVLNDELCPDLNKCLDNVMAQFNPTVGYINTVISARRHKAYFSQHKSSGGVSPPIEFYTYTAN